MCGKTIEYSMVKRSTAIERRAPGGRITLRLLPGNIILYRELVSLSLIFMDITDIHMSPNQCLFNLIFLLYFLLISHVDKTKKQI